MGNWRDSIPSNSKWLKAADLSGGPRLVTIAKFTEETIKGEQLPKPAVWFREEDKALILNITNGKKIEQITGTADPDGWTGKRVVLYQTETQFGDEMVDCIRVRAPKAGAAPPAPPARKRISEEESSGDYQPPDDDVPF